jgi:hypothetical protein
MQIDEHQRMVIEMTLGPRRKLTPTRTNVDIHLLESPQ